MAPDPGPSPPQSPPKVTNRYCGSKHDHPPHDYRGIGYGDPRHCRGKGAQRELPPPDPTQVRRREALFRRAGGEGFRLPPATVKLRPIECPCVLCGVPMPPDVTVRTPSGADNPGAWDYCGDCCGPGPRRHHP